VSAFVAGDRAVKSVDDTKVQ
jgi:two-component sensor histidine kinase